MYNPHGFCVKIRELHGWAAIVAQGLSRGRSQNARQDKSSEGLSGTGISASQVALS